jgi:hypothetical protein
MLSDKLINLRFENKGKNWGVNYNVENFFLKYFDAETNSHEYVSTITNTCKYLQNKIL